MPQTNHIRSMEMGAQVIPKEDIQGLLSHLGRDALPRVTRPFNWPSGFRSRRGASEQTPIPHEHVVYLSHTPRQ